MRELFDHLQDARGMEITICTLMEESKIAEPNPLDLTAAEYVVARGVAIQNPLDQYSRRRGNMIARGRAHKAHRRGESSNRLSPRMMENLNSLPIAFNLEYKCQKIGGLVSNAEDIL